MGAWKIAKHFKPCIVGMKRTAGSMKKNDPAGCENQYPNRDCQRGARSLSSLVGIRINMVSSRGLS